MIRASAMVALREIGRLEKVLEEMAYLPRKLAVEAAPGITKELRKQFDKGLDPYGRPWRPLKQSTIDKGRKNPPLSDTLKLRNGTKATPAPGGRAGLRIKVGAPYGYFHQVGFRVGKTKVGPRRILPQMGMPAVWRRILDAAALRCARRIARGSR